MRLIVLLALLIMPTTASAQGVDRLAPHPSPLFDTRPDRYAALFEARPAGGHNAIAPTHWQEGAIAGGVILGLLGGAVGGGLCQMDESSSRDCTGSAVGGFVMGGLLGVAVGALIGGQFRK